MRRGLACDPLVTFLTRAAFLMWTRLHLAHLALVVLELDLALVPRLVPAPPRRGGVRLPSSRLRGEQEGAGAGSALAGRCIFLMPSISPR
jgi:hypothetical protein